VKKTAWTPDEDQLLLELFDKFGSKWSLIARHIAGRTDDACSKRYRESLDPTLKKDQWTPVEDAKLMESYNRIGGKWGQVGQELQRSGLGCRNRWRLLERKKAAKANQDNNPTQVSPVHEIPSFAFTAGNISPSLISSEIFPPVEAPAAITVGWPPYYPPEAYSTLASADDDMFNDSPFHAFTPALLERPNPEGAPFQFSSSSLSAALSDPHPLPPSDTPELSQDTLDANLSPLSPLPEIHDVLMSPNDSPYEPQLEVEVSQPYEDSFFFPITDRFQYISPISFPTELSHDNIFQEMWKMRGTEEIEFDSPRSVLDGLVNFADFQDTLSSPLSTPYSTPFFHSNPLSPTSSPNPISFVDLPNAELPSAGSLLFSPTVHPRRPAKKISLRKHKSTMKIPLLTRLSSSLPLSSDPNIKPYACGRPSCWSNNQDKSSNCFATSGELQDHAKDQHAEEEGFDKPYRCALAGCGKSWKSINGLQYHLQISTVHFTNALHDKFSKQPVTPVHQMSLLSTEGDSEDSDRRYPCPQLGCYKAYRQPSGLRYHLKHGHPPDLPTQLNIVPPALERQLPTKAKKMRPKPSIDGTMVQLEQSVVT
jgi:myb proto-oncogene protein/Myb-like DNA-binding protein BAS1